MDSAHLFSPQLILFDFDGTLADGYAGIAAAANAVRHSHGLPPLPLEEIKRYVGWGLDYLITNVVPTTNVLADVTLYREHYAETMLTGTELLPDAYDVVHSLGKAGHKLGVCSNKRRPFTEVLLERLCIMPPIEKVFGPDDVANHKPAPDMILAAMSYFRTRADATLYIGDMDVDILCGHAAGVPVWTVPTGAMSAEQLQNANASRVLANLQEVLTLLRGR
jgi:phosphoglycolate phosphatase